MNYKLLGTGSSEGSGSEGKEQSQMQARWAEPLSLTGDQGTV